jgi:hypothetical protein
VEKIREDDTVWFKVDDEFGIHPKVLAIPKQFRARTCGTWLLCGNYSARYRTDGFISPGVLREIGGTRADADRLVAAAARPGGVGLWVEVSEGWVFHDWAIYQPLREALDAKSRTRAEAGRKGGQASGLARRLRSVAEE